MFISKIPLCCVIFYFVSVIHLCASMNTCVQLCGIQVLEPYIFFFFFLYPSFAHQSLTSLGPYFVYYINCGQIEFQKFEYLFR